jgi:hypothetical protein
VQRKGFDCDIANFLVCAVQGFQFVQDTGSCRCTEIVVLNLDLYTRGVFRIYIFLKDGKHFSEESERSSAFDCAFQNEFVVVHVG